MGLADFVKLNGGLSGNRIQFREFKKFRFTIKVYNPKMVGDASWELAAIYM